MTGLREEVYEPDPARAAVYDELYGVYRTLHDSFGLPGERDVSRVMKDLLAIRAKAARP
jgi:L-ribulokinase